MPDQPAPAAPVATLPPVGPIDPVSGAMTRSHVSMPPPNMPPHVPTSSDMDRAAMSPDQRYRANVDGADRLARSYDKPTEPSRPTGAAGETPRADAPDLAQTGERRYTVGEGRDAISLTYDEARGIMAKMAEEATIKNTIRSATDLRVEPTSDFKPPPGFEFPIDPNNPLARAAQQWAFEAGVGQEKLSRLVDIYATQQLEVAQNIKQAREREAAELGSAAPQRVDAVLVWLKANLGDDLAKAMADTMFTAKSVMAIEKIIMKFSGYNGSNIGAGRSYERPGISDEAWSKMNWNERRDYQRQHTEAQQQTRRR